MPYFRKIFDKETINTIKIKFKVVDGNNLLFSSQMHRSIVGSLYASPLTHGIMHRLFSRVHRLMRMFAGNEATWKLNPST